MSTMPD